MSVNSAVKSDRFLTVSVVTGCVDLAASSLSKHLGVSEASAKEQLLSGRVAIGAEQGPQSILGLLRVAGVEIGAFEPALYSSALRAPGREDLAAGVLARLLNRPADQLFEALKHPWGLILQDRTKSEIDRLQKAVGRQPAITMTVSAQCESVLDIFAVTAIPPRYANAVSGYIADHGLRPCRFSGALLSDLSYSKAMAITRRFSESGLLALDRAFQRFDLFMTGIGDRTAAEVKEFLLMRGDQSGRLAECISPMAPLLVETGLGRAAVMAFCADYAAIGLDVVPRLATANR